jgi:hypothetical protein
VDKHALHCFHQVLDVFLTYKSTEGLVKPAEHIRFENCITEVLLECLNVVPSHFIDLNPNSGHWSV